MSAALIRPGRLTSALLLVATAGLALVTACSSSSGGQEGGGPASTGASAAASAANSSSDMSGMAGMGSASAAGTGAASGNSTGDSVMVKNFSFSPTSLTVAVGATVTWTFDDSAKHTVTAKDKSFSSPALGHGQTYRHTFTIAGTYQYICSIHQYMTGTIVVK
jgi:plastocyanin